MNKRKLPKAPTITKPTNAVRMPLAHERVSMRGRGRKLYPFETLTTVGMSFGVKGRSLQQMRSVVSAHNRKYSALAAKHKTQAPRYYVMAVDPLKDKDNATIRVFREV